MANVGVVPAHRSRLRTILEELDLKPGSLVVLVLGWVIVWIVCLPAHRPLPGIAATACWLAAVLAFHAWADLRQLQRNQGSDSIHVIPLARYHWWLAPAALVAGILFGYRLW